MQPPEDSFDDLLQPASVAPAADPYPNIPAEMKAANSWLVYKMEPGSDGHKNKIPYNPKTGRKANDPKLGVTYAEALAVEKDYDGLGFYVEPPHIVVDIDNCISTDGTVAPYAAEIVRELNSYSEASPSRTGIHIWAFGEKPGDKCRRGIELYSTKRFLTVTGEQIPTTPNEVKKVNIKPIYDRMLAGEFETEKAPVATEPTPAAPNANESAQIEQTGTAITNKLHILMQGEIVSQKPFVISDGAGKLRYQSQSEADQALANLLAVKHEGDPAKIDAEFRTSALYRDKWDRQDYRDGTIKLAVAFYEKSAAGKATKENPAPENLAPTGWRSQFSTVGQLQKGGVEMLIDGFLPCGVNMLGALPGNCKTLLALSITKALTTGKLFLGKFNVPELVPVLYLIPESSGGPFRIRCESFGIPDNPELFLCRTVSQGGTLLMDDPILKSAVQYLRPLVILDTAIRFNKSQDENSASANKLFVDDAIALLAAGARAILGLHHATKNSRKEGLTLESALRGTGDLAAMCDSVYGLRRNDVLYADGAGPLQLQVMCLKARDFESPQPFTIAATSKVNEKLVSNIDTNGDFAVLDVSDQLQGLEDRFVVEVTKEPELTLAEVAQTLGVPKPRIQRLAKKLRYEKAKGGPWHRNNVSFSADGPNEEIAA